MTGQLQPKPGEGSGPLWTDLVWTDLIGRCRVIRARTDALEDGIRVPGELASAGYDGPGWNREPVIAVPDWQSRRGHPWEDRSQIVLANLQDLDGSDSPLCSRSALRRVLGRIADAGYEVRAAAELEFFLLDATTGLPLYREIQNYSITKGADLEPLLGPVRQDLEQMSIPIEAVNPEYAGGQVELNIRYGPDSLPRMPRSWYGISYGNLPGHTGWMRHSSPSHGQTRLAAACTYTRACGRARTTSCMIMASSAGPAGATWRVSCCTCAISPCSALPRRIPTTAVPLFFRADGRRLGRQQPDRRGASDRGIASWHARRAS